MSPFRQFPILLITGIMLLMLGVALWYAVSEPQTQPEIRGKFIDNPVRFPAFTLTDHNNRPFTRNNLLGQWHFVSYGYTYCPDICPITLAVLAQVVERLEREHQYRELGALFYSVDPQRDTTERLAEYVAYFHPDFIGLTLSGAEGENSRPFERHLHIVYELEEPAEIEGYPIGSGDFEDNAHYLVNHGILLYLLNPRGQLQAIFEPEKTPQGIYYFSADQLYRDYLAIASID